MSNQNILANVKNSVWSPLNIDGCVAYWPFDETLAYLNAKDIVGGYDLTVSNNPAPELDRNNKIGSRRLFASQNGNAAGFIRSGTVTSIPVIAQGQSFSFSFWMYFEPGINNQGTASTAFMINFSNTVDGNGQIRLGSGNPNIGWTTFSSRLYYTDSTFTTVWLGNNNNPTNLLSILPQNQWSHWVWVYDSVLHQVRLYLNGNLINTVAATIGKISSGIGGGLRTGGSNWQAPGLLDDVALFNKVLSQQEISLLSSTNAPIFGAEKLNALPANNPGCSLWLDSSDSSSIILTNNKVSQWTDKSGNGFHAVQSADLNRPSYVSNVQNGLSSIYFNSANPSFMTTNITGGLSQTSQPYTLFIVAKKVGFDISTVGSSSVLVGRRTSGCFSSAIYFGSTGSVTSALTLYLSGPEFNIGTVSHPSSDPIIITLSKTSTSSYTARLSGVTAFSNNTTSISTARDIFSNIGSSCSGAAPFDGYIYEILLFNYVMTDEEELEYEKYLSDKWGIGLYKPLSGHRDVQNWIERVYANNGTLSQDTVDHVTNFCYEIDNAGLRSKFIRLNLFCGNDIEACATPLYVAPTASDRLGFSSDILTYWGSNLPFKNSDYIERGTNGGLTGRYTSTNYDNGPGLRTGIAATQITELLSVSKIYQRSAGTSRLYDGLHLSVFCKNLINQKDASNVVMGAYQGVFGEGRHGSNITFGRNNESITLGTFVASSSNYFDRINRGLYLYNVFVTDFVADTLNYYSELNLYTGKNKYATALLGIGPFAFPNDISIFSENRANLATTTNIQGLFRSTQNLQGYSIGRSLNESEVEQFYTILNKFQNKLGRGLPDNTTTINNYGPELVTEPTVTTLGDGQIFTIFRDSTTATSLNNFATVTAGQNYKITWYTSANRGTTISVGIRQGGSTIPTTPNINRGIGLYDATFTARDNGTISLVADNAGPDFDLDYVSVKSIDQISVSTTVDPVLSSITNADTIDWLSRVYANGGSVSLSTATAVQNFCNSIESAGLRSLFIRLNLFCGNNLNACFVPLYRGPNNTTKYGNAVDQNYFENFNNNDYIETGTSGGLKGDGLLKGLVTGVIATDIPTNFHLSTYVSEKNITNSLGYDISAVNSDGNSHRIGLTNVQFGSPGYVFSCYEAINTPYTATTASYTNGFYIGSCLTSTAKLYKNGASVSSSTNTGNNRQLRNYPLMIFGGAQSATNYMRNFSPARLSAYSCGLSMDDTQAANFNTIMQTFQTLLNRNV